MRAKLDLPVFEPARPAWVKPVTHMLTEAHSLAVPAALAPADDDLVGHLLFALKHEGVNLQVLTAAREFMAGLSGDLLDRTLSCAYLHETQDSDAIEKEAPSEDKARNFMRLLRQAHEPRRVVEQYLMQLQASIISNPYNEAVQYRAQQNWLSDGQRGSLGVTYVPPPPEHLPLLMAAWERFANRDAASINPLMAASIVSFGFVFLHPFMDGNGRLSRFLFHKALCQSGQLKDGTLLPVSVAMKRHEAEYIRVLQAFSRPARELVSVRAAGEGDFDFTFKCSDTVFRYWDATACVEFGLRMAQEALELELRKEADFILHFDAVRKSIDELYDLRGSTLAVLVSIALNTSGVISATKRTRYAEEVPEAAFAAIELRAREVLGLSGA